jgi:glycosyltransferase involved in cell wall biosynthesis
VSFVGAWHRGKGVFLLADAIDAAHEQNPRIHGLWLGGGAHETELRARLADKPWHHVMGWQNPATPWYSAMDVLALPSTEPDTFGRVCLEAQSCGTAVLGADMGGIPESFEANQSGLLLPAGCLGRWQEAILRLAEDTSLLARLAAAGPDFVKPFSADRVALELLRVLSR